MARSQTLTKRVKALKVLRIQPINHETSASMEIDEDPKSSADTRSHRIPTEDNLEIITEKKKDSSVEPLSKKEKIATLVQAHVALRD
ncbi:hypothetical protein PCASD_20221 [Puccinia coronata f. sp. avenae]|uniref:Uncharacterized protein n=1 Tax=Puccinia coronata f. sp. avenae TaxID=200324 RepID=A0A2N5TVZ1_9BASI|nr:hypothetical protein PCASD_20221 [Puccinia coronata f. sp. avenae]